MSLWNQIVVRERANRKQLENLKLRREELSEAKKRNRKNIGDAKGALTTLRGNRLPNARKSKRDIWTKEVKEKRDIGKKENEWKKKKAENFSKFHKASGDTKELRRWESWAIQNKWYWFNEELQKDIYEVELEFRKHFSNVMHRISRAWDRALNPAAYLPTARFGGNLYMASVTSGKFSAEPPSTEKLASLDKKLVELAKNLEEFKREATKQDYQFLRAYSDIGHRAFEMRQEALEKVNAIMDRIDDISKQLRQFRERTGYLDDKGKEYAEYEKQLADEWKMLQNKKAQLYRYMRARRR